MVCKRVTIICFCLVFWSVCCKADTLIITYSSGKTQAVALDDSIQAVSSLKYLAGDGSETNVSGATETKAPQNAVTTPKPEAKPDVKVAPATKGKVKFRWAEPMSGE
ncbi:MAG: hypothetical protein CXR30_15030 [Geobacter sp.]|nr:MAG: hypothetical protein CXR30_15030 [Geobacter sp.]